MIRIDVQKNSDTVIVRVEGDLTLGDTTDLRKTLINQIVNGVERNVIVDLSRVRYIDSMGVASLVEGLKASRDKNVRFAVAGLQGNVKEVFELSKLSRIFEHVEVPTTDGSDTEAASG